MFVTVGVLMKKMESGLRGISHLIIDEIHERDINVGICLRLKVTNISDGLFIDRYSRDVARLSKASCSFNVGNN